MDGIGESQSNTSVEGPHAVHGVKENYTASSENCIAGLACSRYACTKRQLISKW
jgi:hypothetical protein